MLCRMAWLWITPLTMQRFVTLLFTGCAGACIVFYFGFSRVALKNIDRMRRLPAKACFFAFQAWKSYFLIAFMIALGITLRHSPVPRSFLAVIYFTIGGALFLSSFRYYLRIFDMNRCGDEKPGD